MQEKFLRFRENPLWKLLVKLQETVIVVCGTLCCMIFVVEVFIRYVLKVDFLGYDEIVMLFAAWLYFIGGSYAMYKKEHISADMMGLVLKGRALQGARAVTSWVTFVITIVLSVWGVEFFLYALTRTARTTVWKMPLLMSQSALTVGYILMALYALFYAIEDTCLFAAGRTGTAGEKEGET